MTRISTLQLFYLVNLTCFVCLFASDTQPRRTYRVWRLGVIYFPAYSYLVCSLLLFGMISV
jgi:hypothetical protein